jgi:rhamnulokinase
MGLWIIQEVQRLLPSQPSFATLVDLARNDPFPSIFDVNDPRFLKPDNMIKEIQAYFTEKGLLAPQSAGQLASCVYHSLAECYKKAINELEAITGNAYECINIVGGGCKNILLNELIYEKTRKKVLAGPIEATAIGNLSAQMMADHLFEDVEHLRNAIGNSFEIETYQ